MNGYVKKEMNVADLRRAIIPIFLPMVLHYGGYFLMVFISTIVVGNCVFGTIYALSRGYFVLTLITYVFFGSGLFMDAIQKGNGPLAISMSLAVIGVLIGVVLYIFGVQITTILT